MSGMFNVHKTPEIKNEISSGEFETIFNINIWSRYDDDRELGEMLWFCKYIDKAGLTSYIEELFYDSKADICSIKLIKLEEEDIAESYEIEAIRVIAQLTIDQFEINGVVGHKNPYLSNILKVVI
ncbi:hypothetical protein OW666_11500 [Acinetobacter baumannii]|uniref:hypothetical protein n=1 Tax=Acinetobacter baumannii TaxID=470 RepID=UPI00234275B4|nr:hypothetical protein [Acinetobacter baumannii]MDC4605345.1 hypothetical protein [Acinetobacter baumannii]MDK2129573.1 hypothetical protein [Acinetobacter baumannii]MDK2160223.1 hypothetical protein [Acinetobacter baumannii]MDK2167682.1 hypothetical protein [Acinetobacter baumannii]MDK2251259.1 hypothetical protein [Acinetobacter baumannii]